MFGHPYASAKPESSKAIIDLNSAFQGASAELPPTTRSHSMVVDFQMDLDNAPMTDNFVVEDSNSEAVEEPQDISMPSFPPLHVRSPFTARVEDDDNSDPDDSGIDEGDIPLEDSEESRDNSDVDWETLEVELTLMDTSGQDYAVHAAEVGMSPSYSLSYFN